MGHGLKRADQMALITSDCGPAAQIDWSQAELEDRLEHLYRDPMEIVSRSNAQVHPLAHHQGTQPEAIRAI